MTNPIAKTLTALLLSVAALPAQAFELRLPAEDYGKVTFSARQSLGDAARIVQDRKNVFEPISSRREDDPLRNATRAVGRLDLLIEEDGERYASSCTATVVNDGAAILTNHHCIPGFTGQVLEASILLDYFDADSETIRLNVATTPLATDGRLDFSLVEVLGAVPKDIPAIAISEAEIKPLKSLMIIHHPQGLPKKLTRFGCQAAESLSPQTNLRHRCDTLPGSSGAPIFNEDLEIVGLHHSGGLTSDDPKSFNLGTRLASVMAATTELKPPVSKTPSTATEQPAGTPPTTATGTVNALIETEPTSSGDAATQINQILETE